MPTYEYKCKDCGHNFETFQSITEASLTDCPKCGGSISRVIGNVGVSFKGSGFYINDKESGKSSSQDTKKSDK